MLRDQAWEGPRQAAVATPALAAGGVRRTTSIESNRPDGLGGPIVVRARARDAIRRAGGWEVVEEAAFDLTVDGFGAELRAVDRSPVGADLGPLVGTSLRGGLRARLAGLVPDDVARCSPLHTLLDDLPGATLVAGYGALRAMPDPLPMAPESVDRNVDQCAGWAADAVMVTVLRTRGLMPVSLGEPVASLTPDDDPLAWHDLGTMGPHGMRRRRRLDLAPDGRTVEAFFRDSHTDADGVEEALHEYTVTATVDLDAGVVAAASAVAGALPWRECPGALASAGRIAGLRLDELRARVRTDLTGTSTCTHLNDTLRVLVDVVALAAWKGGRP